MLDGTKGPSRERIVHSDRNADSSRAARPERPHAARYRAYTDGFGRLYDDPGLARWKFLRAAEADGADRAAAELRANPSRYGTVRPNSTVLQKQIGGLMQRLTGAAQQQAVRAMGPMAQAPLQMIQTINQVRQLAMMVKAPHLALAQAALQTALRMVRVMDDRGGREWSGRLERR